MFLVQSLSRVVVSSLRSPPLYTEGSTESQYTCISLLMSGCLDIFTVPGAIKYKSTSPISQASLRLKKYAEGKVTTKSNPVLLPWYPVVSLDERYRYMVVSMLYTRVR